MLIFISLFTHHGNQEWGVDEGDGVNAFFLLLAGKFSEMAGDYSRAQGLVELCPQVPWRWLSLVGCYSLGHLATQQPITTLRAMLESHWERP